jgi:predicted nucleic acid-binding protein
MNAAIVDTDVVSMLFKGDTRALAYRPHITGRLLGISFMTLAELERWPLERKWGQGRKLELVPRPRDYFPHHERHAAGGRGMPRPYKAAV